ncbi:MAG TPA: NAD(P)-dependent oxidoreductase [Burkholderiales bacterium]|jgi:3-hydroxyisobutyrate dehydrogenase-like beta-hydroxyacid dehydrogenase|nr:NAD(P)-dependent oxidoreductase [Burkholderiales bacterium]
MLGFIGLGTMGAPICRNLAAKSGQEVRAYDSDLEALSQMAQAGVTPAESVRDVAEHADVVFLSLPGGPQVQEVCMGAGSLLTHLKPGGLVVDLSTAPVSLARELHARFAARGIHFADAPVARTRQAAIDGTLSVMVGAAENVFARLKPLLECFATDITLCGGPGTGQAMKIINNMVLFQNVVAIAEALALVGRLGLDPELALQTLAKGSADSFALRNHGMKAMLKGEYPEKAFSTEYALKDIRYALRLGEQQGLVLPGADHAKEVIKEAIRAGYGKEYFPALAKVIAAPAAAKKKGG